MRLALRITRSFANQVIDYKAALQTHYRHNDPLSGACSPSLSAHFASRHPKIHPDHWRIPQNLPSPPTLSGLGLGTYMGEATNEHDYVMFRGIVDSVQSGVNVLDTCPLFRYGKSEKVICAAMNFLIKEHNYQREEFWVGTKCGYVPVDIDSGLSQKDFLRVLVEEKIIDGNDVLEDTHCISPGFLDFSIEKSRLSLGLETIDVAYLNNFSEAHLPMVGEQKAFERLRLAFRKFQDMRKQNRIKYYGACSYVGLRSPQAEEGVHFKLQKAIQLAKQEGGDQHGFRFIMVPFSLGLPEIMYGWQNYEKDGVSKTTNIFEICEKEGINVVTCQPFFQGQYANLPFQSQKLSHIQSNSGKHLQIARSLFYNSYLNTILGQTQPQHIRQNMEILKHPRLNMEEWLKILQIQQ